jgi:hypothetical protein
MRPEKGDSSTMNHYYKITKNPKTQEFENAAWLDVGRFYYIAFPDGGFYVETYCKWEFQEEEKPATEETPLLKKTA